jgi:oxygen-dependent protoporphyrinogen oxidase
MSQVVLVGGGISGLTLAYRLAQLVPQAKITLLEARNRAGGTVWTEHLEGFQVEIGPNGFLDNKPFTLTLCRDLGLGDQLVAGSDAAGRNRYLFRGNRLHALPAGLGAFLRSDLLSWRGKLALLTEPLRRRRRGSTDESIAQFVRRRAGKEAAEILADALVTGIYAGDPALLSVEACFPRLPGFESHYGSVFRGFAHAGRQRRAEAAARGEPPPRPGRMWSLRGGLGQLIERLSDRLPRPPIQGVAVRRVERKSDGRSPWTVRGSGQDTWTADAVVLACPAFEQASILADLDAELATQIGSIAYNRIAVVAVGYRALDLPTPPDGFGFIAPQRDRRDLLGVQWCSSIFPERAPAGLVLLRAMCGGWNRPEMVDWTEDQLLQAVRAELRLSMGITAPPVFHHLVRWDRAIPQYHVGHRQRVAGIMERAGRYPGLFLAGNAYQGVALNDCVEQAELLAARVSASLAHTS